MFGMLLWESQVCFVLELRRKRKNVVFFFSLLELNNYNGYVCAIFNCCFL